MKDTPRTDDQIGYDGSTMSAIRIEFCRQLERELNAANKRLEEIETSGVYDGRPIDKTYLTIHSDVLSTMVSEKAYDPQATIRERLIRERDEARAERDEAAKVVEKALSELGQVARSRCALIDHIKRLEEALEGTVKWIVDLANSGDAGFWNSEEQPEIIAARDALKKEAKL